MAAPTLLHETRTVFVPTTGAGLAWDDAEIAVYVTDVSGRDRQIPLLFLHGWGLSPRSYRALCDEIALLGYTVYAPAIPGFGGSAPLPDSLHHTFDRTAALLAETIPALALPTPLPCVGHSFGAGLGVTIADRNPGWISALVLLCPIGGAGPGVTTWLRLLGGLRHELTHDTLPRTLDAIPSLLHNPIALAASGIAAKHADLVDPIQRIAHTHVPVTVVSADQDTVVPTGRIAHVDNITYIPVHGKHGWPLTHPQECASLIATGVR